MQRAALGAVCAHQTREVAPHSPQLSEGVGRDGGRHRAALGVQRNQGMRELAKLGVAKGANLGSLGR